MSSPKWRRRSAVFVSPQSSRHSVRASACMTRRLASQFRSRSGRRDVDSPTRSTRPLAEATERHDFLLARMTASLPTRFDPTPSLLNGHTARQIAQLSASLKYGANLLKSTYHRRSPRTSAFSSPMAFGGLRAHPTVHAEVSCAEIVTGIRQKGAFVSAQAKRKFEPSLW
jgi:hypothetical protein